MGDRFEYNPLVLLYVGFTIHFNISPRYTSYRMCVLEAWKQQTDLL